MACASHTDSRGFWEELACPPAHGAMAPSSIESAGLGTTSSGSTSYLVPSPSHASHAPYGELNEKFRCASSPKLRPHVGQARCWLKVSISSSTPSSSRETM